MIDDLKELLTCIAFAKCKDLCCAVKNGRRDVELLDLGFDRGVKVHRHRGR